MDGVTRWFVSSDALDFPRIWFSLLACTRYRNGNAISLNLWNTWYYHISAENCLYFEFRHCGSNRYSTCDPNICTRHVDTTVDDCQVNSNFCLLNFAIFKIGKNYTMQKWNSRHFRKWSKKFACVCADNGPHGTRKIAQYRTMKQKHMLSWPDFTKSY